MTMETIRLIEEARKLSDSEWEELKQKLIKDIESSEIEKEVSNLLIQLGVPMKNRGFKYLKEAIMISLNNPEVLDGITKRLYPAIAKEFDTTWWRVERCITFDKYCKKYYNQKVVLKNSIKLERMQKKRRIQSAH